VPPFFAERTLLSLHVINFTQWMTQFQLDGAIFQFLPLPERRKAVGILVEFERFHSPAQGTRPARVGTAIQFPSQKLAQDWHETNRELCAFGERFLCFVLLLSL